MSNEIVLVITEGKKPEFSILNDILKIIEETRGNTPKVVKAYWKSDIVSLCKKIVDDPDLDYISILQDCPEMLEDSSEITSISRDMISQTYLFFDHDVQCVDGTYNGNLEKFSSDIRLLLNQCNNETSPFGKLLISYPMIESLWDHPWPEGDCNTLCPYPIVLNKQYKCYISKNIKRSQPITNEYLLNICNTHLKRGLQLLNDKIFIFNNTARITQLNLFEKEILGIQSSLKTLPINAIPFFLIDIFGESFFDLLLENSKPLCALKCFDNTFE